MTPSNPDYYIISSVIDFVPTPVRPQIKDIYKISTLFWWGGCVVLRLEKKPAIDYIHLYMTSQPKDKKVSIGKLS